MREQKKKPPDMLPPKPKPAQKQKATAEVEEKPKKVVVKTPQEGKELLEAQAAGAPANAGPVAEAMDELQRKFGNAYVQKLVGKKEPKPPAKGKPASEAAQEQEDTAEKPVEVAPAEQAKEEDAQAKADVGGVEQTPAAEVAEAPEEAVAEAPLEEAVQAKQAPTIQRHGREIRPVPASGTIDTGRFSVSYMYNATQDADFTPLTLAVPGGVAVAVIPLTDIRSGDYQVVDPGGRGARAVTISVSAHLRQPPKIQVTLTQESFTYVVVFQFPTSAGAP